MQQAEEAAAEPEAERTGRLGLVGQRRIVQLQSLQRITQRRVVVAVDRIQAGVDHRVRMLVAPEGLGRTVVLTRHRVTDAGLTNVLHPGDQVADLADAQVGGLHRLGADHADLEHFVDDAVGHHLDAISVREFPSITRT